MNVVKGVTSIAICLLSGWLGVFSLLITSARIIGDVFHSGELRAVPRAVFDGIYGFSWRIAFYIGSLPVWNSTEIALASLGFILFVVGILLGFNALKNRKSAQQTHYSKLPYTS